VGKAFWGDLGGQKFLAIEWELQSGFRIMKNVFGRSIVGVVGFGCVALMVFGVGRVGAGEISPAVEALMKERVAVLEQLVKVAEERYRSGNALFNEVLEAKQELWGAKLKLVSDKDVRVALREEMLANLTALEQLVKAQADAAVVGAEVVLRAKAARLEAEAMLLLEAEK
jgi:hypothetical protein